MRMNQNDVQLRTKKDVGRHKGNYAIRSTLRLMITNSRYILNKYTISYYDEVICDFTYISIILMCLKSAHYLCCNLKVFLMLRVFAKDI
jgi:hypothetical protein